MSALVPSASAQSSLPVGADAPLLQLLSQQRENEKSFLRDAQARADLRHALWLQTMLDPEQTMQMRLRASELSAKSDGDFDKAAAITNATMREMFLSPHNRLRDTFPAIQAALQSADDVEEAEFELVEDDDAAIDYLDS